MSARLEEEVSLNFVNADIEGVVKTVSHLTGRNFLIDPRIKGTINIVSSHPIPKSLAYETLISALRIQGFTVVENRGLTKVTLESDARIQPGPVSSKKGSDKILSGEQIVTRVFQIDNESAAQMVNVLRPLMSPNMSINTTQNSNMLIITDSADNLNRLASIISAIDVPSTQMPIIIPLMHISANDAVTQINKVFGSAGGGSAAAVPGKGGLIAVAETKSNRIILRSDDTELLRRAQSLISQIDKPESSTGNIHVIPLKNADAVQLAATLRVILGGEGSASGAPSASSISTPSISSASSSGTGASNTNIPSFAQTNTSGALTSGSIIQADVASNSLIVTAPDSVYRNLLQVIDKLDKRRAQVYLEVLIAEISSDKAAEMGFQWQSLNGLSSSSASFFGSQNFGGSGTNISSVSANPSTIGQGFSFGIVKGQTTIPGVGTIANIGLLARFLETKSSANILSAPNILTLDNEEAQIVIGQNVPFTTGSYTSSTTGSTNPFQTYERKDVGLTLKVKPQITAGGVVMINIFQEVSSVQSGTSSNTAGPTTNKRALQSKILVDDGNMIVLGGLIEDSNSNENNKVPVLGDVPIIGNLFRHDGRKRTKTNLMVFIRPTIIRDVATYKNMTAGKYVDHAVKEQALIANTPTWRSDPDDPIVPPQNYAALQPGMAASYTPPVVYVNNNNPTAQPQSTQPTQPTQPMYAPNNRPLVNTPIYAPNTAPLNGNSAYLPANTENTAPLIGSANYTPYQPVNNAPLISNSNYGSAPTAPLPAPIAMQASAPAPMPSPSPQPTYIAYQPPNSRLADPYQTVSTLPATQALMADQSSDWQQPSSPRYYSTMPVQPKTYAGGRTIE